MVESPTTHRHKIHSRGILEEMKFPMRMFNSHTRQSSAQMRGFTLVELLVTASIFVFMTALVVAKYGTFNQSVLLTNLAYDVALTIRTAQTYGVSVQAQTTGSTAFFNYPYGVHFDTSAGNNQNMVIFVDTNQNNIYDSSIDTIVASYSIKNGGTIVGACGGSGSCSGTGSLDIFFKRPDPSAVICYLASCTWTYAQVVIQGPGTTDTRSVIIQQNGQITVGS